MWLVAIVLDTAFLHTTEVNLQQFKMHLEKKKESFLPFKTQQKDQEIICAKRIFF